MASSPDFGIRLRRPLGSAAECENPRVTGERLTLLGGCSPLVSDPTHLDRVGEGSDLGRWGCDSLRPGAPDQEPENDRQLREGKNPRDPADRIRGLGENQF